MKNLWILAVVALLSACSASTVPQTQIPNRAQENLKKQYPSATMVEWSKTRKDATTTYSATFKNGGDKVMMKFNEQGEVISSGK